MRDRNPRCWLMTDERMGDRLWPALRRLPPGSGVVFRHRAMLAAERHALWLKVRRMALARRLVLVSAGDLPGTRGRHGGPRPLTAPAHDRGEAVRAVRRGAHYVFVSPVFATRSHPGAPALGAMKAAALTGGLPVRTIALGAMTARRWRRIRHCGFDGWAAIDALTP